MDINFELYKIFYQAASCLNFTQAAEKLFISQSAVSQSIKNLESSFKLNLFIRKGKTINLTNEGELLYHHIGQAYNLIKSAENKLSEITNLETGEIRIGASDTICKYHLLPYIQYFISKYPNIKIQLINRTSNQILDLLKKGSLDFGIITSPLDSRDFNIRVFCSVEDIFICNNKFIDLKNRLLNLGELSKYPLITLPKTTITRQYLDKLLKENNIVITPEIELESVDLLVEYAKLGMGISHVLKESAKKYIETSELFELKFQERLPKRDLAIVTPKISPSSNASNKFIEILLDNSNSENPNK